MVVRSRAGVELLQRRVERSLPGAHPALLVHTHEGLARLVLAQLGQEPQRGATLSAIGEWLVMEEALCRAQPTLARLGPMIHEPSCIEDAISLVSACKRALVGPGLLAKRVREASGSPGGIGEVAVISAAYQGMLEGMGCLDSRDWHGRALEALLEDRTALQEWADLLLVDEAEDLSPAQWFLIRELGQRLSQPERLVLAGDWSESTPGFRGVSSESSSRPFEEYFPGEFAPAEWSMPETLPVWARRLGAALGVRTEEAGSASGSDQELPEAALRVGPAASVWVAADETAEGLAVAREILRARLDGELEFEDCAILLRSRGAQLAPVLAALSGLGVPHRLAPEVGWAGHSAVATILSWLRCVSQPPDDSLLLEALRHGPSQLSPGAIRLLLRQAGRQQCPAVAAFWGAGREKKASVEPGVLGPTQAEEWKEIGAVSRRWLASGVAAPELGRATLSWPQFLGLVGQMELASGLAAAAVEDFDTASALAQLSRAAAAGAEAHRRMGRAELDLAGWLKLLEAAVRRSEQELDRPAEEGRSEVSVLSMRQAKGRRWARVFVYGCVAGSLPARPDAGGFLDNQEVQELVRLVPELEDVLSSAEGRQDAESRLFMVALTRASSEVTCSWSRRRGGRPAERSPLLGRLLEAGIRERPAPQVELVTVDDVVSELALSPAPGRLAVSQTDLGGLATELRAELEGWDPVAEGAARLPESLAVSATSIAAWLACPRQYLAGLLVASTSGDISLHLGTQAHRLVEQLYQARGDWAGSSEAFRQVASRLIQERVLPELRAEEGDPVNLVYAGLWLERMVARWASRIVAAGPERVGEPIAEEIEFSLDRSSWRLRGKVDALWRHPDGEIELVDYKTSADKKTDGVIRDAVFGKLPEGPQEWQLPIYQLAAREGAFESQLGAGLPARVRNWYVGVDPAARSTEPIPAAGFRIVDGKEQGGVGRLTERELDRIEEELDRQVQVILEGRFPAQPRHSTRTCRAHFGGCPVADWCDGEGTVGAGHPTPLPRL
jgi:superfamily I DNA/RNA helicase